MPRSVYALLALTVATLLSAFSTAGATTFVLMDERTLFHSSAAVIVGTVTAIESGGRPDGPIYTYVHVQPEHILKGGLGLDPVVVREPGGTNGDRREWVYGAPEFWVGERALLFLSSNRDGTLQTNSLAMGKYSLAIDSAGRTTATRDLGAGSSILVPSTGEWREGPQRTERFLPLFRRLRRLAAAEPRSPRGRKPLRSVPEELAGMSTQFHDAYTFLGTPPGRWFEPDTGQPITYLVDSTGDAALGFSTSRAAIDAALGAWTEVPRSSLMLEDGGTTEPGPFNQCSSTRIVFNDPNNEISDPSDCSGVLALGGYCTGGATTTVNDTTFVQILTGKLTFNNGWGGCSVWTECNLAEIATHEIGHTIGLGHSTDTDATMYTMAHFDQRCATLERDDMNGASFMYPQPGTPLTPSPTRTRTAPRSATPTRTGTPTQPSTPSLTATPMNTPTPTQTPTAPPTDTATVPLFTPTATLSPSATPTLTAVPDVSGQIVYYSNGRAVSAAAVEAHGSPPAEAATDASGHFEFWHLSPGNWKLQPVKMGDTGAALDIMDAVSVLESAGGMRALSSPQAVACDVSGDGEVTSADAVLVLEHVVGLTPQFPIAQRCGSDWAFIPVPAAAPYQSIQPLQIVDGSCQPGSIVFEPLSGPALDQNFSAIAFGDCSGDWQPTGASAAITALKPIADRVRLGRGRVAPRTRVVRVPLYVNAQAPFRALDLELRFDARGLRPVQIRLTKQASRAVVAANFKIRGTARIAIASPEPIAGGEIAVLDFEPIGRRSGVIASVVQAAADAQ